MVIDPKCIICILFYEEESGRYYTNNQINWAPKHQNWLVLSTNQGLQHKPCNMPCVITSIMQFCLLSKIMVLLIRDLRGISITVFSVVSV